MSVDNHRVREMPVHRALLEGLNPDPAHAASARAALLDLDAAEWLELTNVALRCRMAPLFWHRLTERGLSHLLPPEAQAQFIGRSRRSTHRALAYQAHFVRLVSLLSARGVRVVGLKGIHLASAVYGSPVLREMNDIDILVPREHVRIAADVAAAEGFRPLGPQSVDLSLDMAHHLPRLVKPGVGLEIHWRLTSGPGSDIVASEVLDRAVPFGLAAGSWVLSAEDAVLHLATHACHAHLFEQGLRPIFDVAALLSRCEVDWRCLAVRANEWRAARALCVVLELARRHGGAQLPSGLFETIGEPPPEALVESALTLCLAPVSPASLPSATAARLLSREPLGERLRHLWRHISCPPHELAFLYNMPVERARRQRTRLRLQRACDLVVRRGPALLSLLARRNLSGSAWIGRRNDLAVWLREG